MADDKGMHPDPDRTAGADDPRDGEWNVVEGKGPASVSATSATSGGASELAPDEPDPDAPRAPRNG